MITFEEYESALKIILSYNKQIKEAYLLTKQNSKKTEIEIFENSFSGINSDTALFTIVSMRLYKSLLDYSKDTGLLITHVKHLDKISISGLSRIRFFGEKSKTEFICLCHAAGIDYCA